MYTCALIAAPPNKSETKVAWQEPKTIRFHLLYFPRLLPDRCDRQAIARLRPTTSAGQSTHPRAVSW